MKIKSVNQTPPGDGSLQGEITISYASLVDQLGQPSSCYDDFKSDAEWQLEFEDGTEATIYNYKDGVNYNGMFGTPTEQITSWHVGGDSPRVMRLVESALGLS